MGRHRHYCELIAILLFAAGTSRVQAGPIFFGPTPYLSTADVPAGFYGGGPTAVETFEDGNLSFGITATAGSVIGPGGLTDSVDADDGSIDGFGSGGRSWFVFSSSSPTEVTFSFGGPLPSAAGLVWTDGYGMVTFEAFGAGMVSLGTIGPLSVTINPNHSGSTFEDRFYGRAIRWRDSGSQDQQWVPGRPWRHRSRPRSVRGGGDSRARPELSGIDFSRRAKPCRRCTTTLSGHSKLLRPMGRSPAWRRAIRTLPSSGERVLPSTEHLNGAIAMSRVDPTARNQIPSVEGLLR